MSALEKAKARILELERLINTPHTKDFLRAVELEAAHQIERWGKQHDLHKTPEDWLWTLCFLATKATQAARYKDKEKYKHHIITSAALLLNWHKATMTTKKKGKQNAHH